MGESNIMKEENKGAGALQTAQSSLQAGKIQSADKSLDHVKISFVTRAPLTEPKIKKLTETAINLEKSLEHSYKVIKSLRISNTHGVHARPATELVLKAKELEAKSIKFTIEKDGEVIEATSVMSIMMQALLKGTQIKLKAKGANLDEIERQLKEILEMCDEGEKVFEEQKIIVDISKAEGIEEKLSSIDEEIKQELNHFFGLFAKTAEYLSSKSKLSEQEFAIIASEFCSLSNVKGIKNDILELTKKKTFAPGTSLEVYIKDLGTLFQISGHDRASGIIMTENLNKELLARCSHLHISKPIEEFNNEIIGIMNGSHAYEIKRAQNKLSIYYDALDKFLREPLDESNHITQEVRCKFKKVLKRRMQYEHHRFIGIKLDKPELV